VAAAASTHAADGNEHLLTVLLRNLLDNAVRYAPTGRA
jgi:two-component system sensor histidine kinase QseC